MGFLCLFLNYCLALFERNKRKTSNTLGGLQDSSHATDDSPYGRASDGSERRAPLALYLLSLSFIH